MSIADLANLVAASGSSQQAYLLGVIEELEKLEVSDDSTVKLIQRILTNKQLGQLSLAAHEAKEGRIDTQQVLDICASLQTVVQKEETPEENIYVSDDIESILDNVYRNPGLRWRLNTMNRMLGSLRDGDFGFVFARPETGKTTFLASELTFMAEQAKRPVIWLANEEDGQKVVVRLYQATFGIDLPTLLSDPKKWKNLFQEKYEGRLKVVSDMSVMSKKNVEKLCDKHNPALLVIDQLSKIGGFAADRKDLELGAACEWGRTMAKTYCPVVAVHQADGTAEGVKWLGMNHVSNAKTAMQAEADWILGIGKIHDPGYEQLRYLALSKNKMSGDPDTDPSLKHGRMEVLIDPIRARYKDVH